MLNEQPILLIPWRKQRKFRVMREAEVNRRTDVTVAGVRTSDVECDGAMYSFDFTSTHGRAFFVTIEDTQLTKNEWRTLNKRGPIKVTGRFGGDESFELHRVEVDMDRLG